MGFIFLSLNSGSISLSGRQCLPMIMIPNHTPKCGIANNNDSYQNISQHDEDSDYKPTKRSSKSSRLRKRLQAAKEEDQDAKYFI